MLSYLSVNKIAFSLLGYPLSYVELIGTVSCLWSVWLVGRRNIWTWPIGIISVLLYFAIFYQIRLYGDVIEQVYYLITNLWGWWLWVKCKETEGDDLLVYRSDHKTMALTAAGTLVVSCFAAVFLYNSHTWLPSIFREEASLPFLDALTTIMSFVATILMVRRRLECWGYWIIVDVIGIGLYYYKGVHFIALLSAILLVLATKGLISWSKVKSATTA